MELDLAFLWYLIPSAAVIAFYFAVRKRSERKYLAVRAAAIEAGLNEPPTLHPKIDPLKCIGCGSCVAACPEGTVIGLIRGKAELIAPSECIGHGACHASCPVDAITLVFGTERRGIDLPHVGADFQTNVAGLYIAGELGGMGLIRNAIEQGRQAIAEIAKDLGKNREALDVIIIGAGPAGFSASLAAKEKRLRYLTVEQEDLGGTVSHFPRGKLVMTAPAELPLHGRVRFSEIGKEDLLAFWTKIANENNLSIDFGERVDAVRKTETGFEVRTSKRTLTSRCVLLTIGRRGTPRRLGIAGEELPNVVYKMIDPMQYKGKKVLVVGGGDSALEAAATLSEETDATVTLMYRGEALGRAKPKNRKRITAASSAGRLHLRLKTNLLEIKPDYVVLDRENRQEILPTEAVIICAGGILPSAFLEDAGVAMETKYGTA